MIVIGFDNKEYKLKLSSKQSSSASNLHKQVRVLLKKLFPLDRAYEEVRLEGSQNGNKKSVLHADFIIPSKRMMIECQGVQHSEHVKFYHPTKMDFYSAKARDKRKLEWCELNNITLVCLEWNEKEEEWIKKINNCYDD